MNYDDLMWKCQGFLSPKDYMRLCGLIVREKERSERIKELNGLAVEGTPTGGIRVREDSYRVDSELG